VLLQGRDREGFPRTVTGIAVDRQAAKLHFLHASTFASIHGRPAAEYVVHYEDGTSTTVPVVMGRDLWDIWGSAEPWPLTRAQIVWTGKNPVNPNRPLTLYRSTWQNPYPDKSVKSLDFRRVGEAPHAPLCVAITCDRDRSPMPPEPGLLTVNLNAGMTRVRLNGRPMYEWNEKTRRNYQVLLPPGSCKLDVCPNGDNSLVRANVIDIAEGRQSFVFLGAPLMLRPLLTRVESTNRYLGHAWGTRLVVFSPDGSRIASGACDGTLRVFDALSANSEPQWEVNAHADTIKGLDFSPDGKHLLSMANNGIVKVWDAASGEFVRQFGGNDGSGRKPEDHMAMALSGDGKQAAVARNGTVEVWDEESGKLTTTFVAHKGKIAALAFSPDSKTIVTSERGAEHAVKVWSLPQGEAKHTLAGHGGTVFSVAFSPTGRILATGSWDGTVRFWNPADGEGLGTLFAFHSINAMGFSPDGSKLATATDAFESVVVWDVASRKRLHEFHAHWAIIPTLMFSPNGKTLATGSFDGSVRLWQLSDLPVASPELLGPKPRLSFPDQGASWGACVAVSPTGDQLASINMGTQLRVWDLKSLDNVADLELRRGKGAFAWSRGLVYSPDGKTLATGLSNGNIALRETTRFQARMTLDTNDSYPALALASDGKRLATTNYTEKQMVTLWDLQTRKTIWQRASMHGKPWTPVFSPDDATLVCGTSGGRILILDAQNGSNITEPLVHGGEVNAVALDPEGRLLVSCGADKLVKLWDMTTFACVAVLKGHQEEVFWAAVSPDGKIVATAGGVAITNNKKLGHDGEVCLWDPATKQLVTRFTGHHGTVQCVVFTPDGKSLVTTGRDGMVHIWDVHDLLAATPHVDATKTED